MVLQLRLPLGACNYKQVLNFEAFPVRLRALPLSQMIAGQNKSIWGRQQLSVNYFNREATLST